MKKIDYALPPLPFPPNALEPFMSEEQLLIHHDKHHAAYVKSANAILEKLEKSREGKSEIDVKAELKALSFNIAGHHLHSLFWDNMRPVVAGNKPAGLAAMLIDEGFGSFEAFKKEFTQAALSVEGSGWAALVCDTVSRSLMVMQIEKHNVNIFPSAVMLLAADVFEHAYYLDYKNDRASYIEGFWDVVDWDAVGRRMENLKK